MVFVTTVSPCGETYTEPAGAAQTYSRCPAFSWLRTTTTKSAIHISRIIHTSKVKVLSLELMSDKELGRFILTHGFLREHSGLPSDILVSLVSFLLRVVWSPLPLLLCFSKSLPWTTQSRPHLFHKLSLIREPGICSPNGQNDSCLHR